MRGHTEIIKARVNGKVPSIVFINDYPCRTDWLSPGAAFNEEWPCDHATVSTHNDPLSSIDFRFLKDLRVSISADSEARAKALYQLAIDAQADTVAACHIQPEKHHLDQSGWCSVFNKNEEVSHGVA